MLYQLQVLPQADTAPSGPAPGDLISVADPILTSPLLSSAVSGGTGNLLLAVGAQHAAVETTTPAGNTGATAKFNILYFNDGAKKANDLKILVPLPANATPFRAAFLNPDLTERGRDASKREFIETPNAAGLQTFHLGKVKAGQSGYVQIEFAPVAGVKPTAIKAVASLISNDGGILAGGGGNVVILNGGSLTHAHQPGGPEPRGVRHPRALASGHPARGTNINSPAIHVTDDGLVIVGGGQIGN